MKIPVTSERGRDADCRLPIAHIRFNPSHPTPPPVPPPDAAPPTAVTAGPQPPVGERIRAYRVLLTLAFTIFVLDQATKLWVNATIPFNPLHAHDGFNDIVVIPGFFYLIHVGNTGAAWSMFSGQSVLLAVLAVGTLMAIFYWRRALGLRDRMTQICFGLLCGGILGNLVDRLLHGHVIDFIDLHFGTYIYPTFNVADSAIVVGVILYIWTSFREGAGKGRERG
jgi:signal peptidase II